MSKRIQYNSPVILTMGLLMVLIYLLNGYVLPNLTIRYFTTGPGLRLTHPIDFFRMFSHVLGHADWQHLFGNLTYLLLLGPILEEKYGPWPLAVMIFFCAGVTGAVHVLLSNHLLLGASGVVFMCIILISMVDLRRGTIPLTFVLVAVIFIGTEVLRAFQADSVSQLAHIVGGIVGAGFGFYGHLLFRR